MCVLVLYLVDFDDGLFDHQEDVLQRPGPVLLSQVLSNSLQED